MKTVKTHFSGQQVTLPIEDAELLAEAARRYAEDLSSGLEDGTYDDAAGLDQIEVAIARTAGACAKIRS